MSSPIAVMHDPSKPRRLSKEERTELSHLHAKRHPSPDDEQRRRQLQSAKSAWAKQQWPARLYELVGTFVLVFSGISAAIQAGSATPIAGQPLSSNAVPLAFAVAVTILVYMLGGEFNPAITLDKARRGELEPAEAVWHIGLQLIGGFLAAGAALYWYVEKAIEADFGATRPAPGTGSIKTVIVEGLAMVALVLVVRFVGSSQDKIVKLLSGILVGATLYLLIQINGPITGGAINYARDLGPDIWSNKPSDQWNFLAALGLCMLVLELISLPRTIKSIKAKRAHRSG